MSPIETVRRWAGHDAARISSLALVALFVVAGSWAIFQTWQLAQKVDDQQQAITRNQQTIRGLVASNADLIGANRRLNCAISKAITANPIVRIPAFESKKEFQRRVAALRLIVSLVKGIDCVAVLAPVSTGAKDTQPLPLPKGGGGQSRNRGQLPAGPGTRPRPANPPSGSAKPTRPPPGGGGPGGGSQPPPPSNPRQICVDNPLLTLCVRPGL